MLKDSDYAYKRGHDYHLSSPAPGSGYVTLTIRYGNNVVHKVTCENREDARQYAQEYALNA